MWGSSDRLASVERKAPIGIIGGPTLKTDWQTPQHILDGARRYWGGQIPCDVATTPQNPTRARRFFAPPDSDGLLETWPAEWWINPPYGKVLKTWLAKAAQEARWGGTGIALLPCARWEQKYFQDVLTEANAVCFIRKRVKFINPATGDAVSGNTYANMFLGFNVDQSRWLEAFQPLGACVALTPLCGSPD